MRRKTIIDIKLESDIRNTWRIMKWIIGKKICNNAVQSKHITVYNTEIYDVTSIEENVTNFV